MHETRNKSAKIAKIDNIYPHPATVVAAAKTAVNYYFHEGTHTIYFLLVGACRRRRRRRRRRRLASSSSSLVRQCDWCDTVLVACRFVRIHHRVHRVKQNAAL